MKFIVALILSRRAQLGIRFLAVVLVFLYASLAEIPPVLSEDGRQKAELTPVATAQPTPTALLVTISNKELTFSESLWSEFTGAGTIALAIATFVLALYTRKLARETQANLAGEDRRHQDSFVPHLALTAMDQGTVQKLIGGGAVKQVMGRELYVRNIGVGPALSVKASVLPSGDDLYVETIPIAFAVGDNVLAIRGSNASRIIEFQVEYEDVFRRKYQSAFKGDFSLNVLYTWVQLSPQ